jgi:hypothetical protein
MNKSELYDRVFETFLQAAVEENFQGELNTLPPEEVLRKEYAPSPEQKQKIQKVIKKAYYQSLRHKAASIAKKAAVIIAIIIPISLGSLLSVEASRNAIFNTVLDWKSDHVNVHFQEDSSGQSRQSAQGADEGGLYQPQYLPDGFTESKTIKVGPILQTKYLNKENVSILFDQTPLSKEGTIALDTEHSTYRKITINGQKASLFAANTPEDKTFILWQDKKTSFMLSSTVDQKELIKMAENIKLENN